MKNLVNDIQYAVVKPSGVGSGTLYISHSSDEDSDRGSLVFFIEIEISDRDNETIIVELEKELSKQYFNSPTDSIEYAFENALAKANVAVKDILLSKPKNWLSKIHIIILATAGDEVHISHVGSAHAFLTHHDHIADILNNTSGQSGDSGYGPRTPNPVKLFSNIISGKLGLNDSITIVSDPVLDYLSPDRIRKTTNDWSPTETISKLSELLDKTPTNKQFGLITMKRTAAAEKTIAQETKKASLQKKETVPMSRDDIMDQYLKPESYEEQSQPMQQAPKMIDSAVEIMKKYGSLTLTIILSASSKALDQIIITFKRFIPKISKLPSIAASMWRNRKSRDYHFSKIRESAKKTAQALPATFSSLPKNRKAIIGSVGILIVVFAASVSWRAQNNASQESKQAYETARAQIEQKRDQAQATLIYKEYDRARQIIAEAQTLLEALPNENTGQAADHEQLGSELATLRDKSERKIMLDDIQPFVTVIPAPVSPQTSGLLTDGTSLFYYDGVQQRIASLDVENQLLLSLALESQDMKDFTTAIYTGNNTIVALRADTAIFVDTKKETVRKELFAFDPALQNLPFASYAGNLYTIDPAQNNIIRYRAAGKGFTTAQEWLTEPYDVTQMKDIAVDGFVYTLNANGDIHIFLRGALNKIIPFPLEDKPAQGARMVIREGLARVYILDPAHSRLITMTPQGELISQYTADMLGSANGIAVLDEEDRVYLLSGEHIYAINL